MSKQGKKAHRTATQPPDVPTSARSTRDLAREFLSCQKVIEDLHGKKENIKMMREVVAQELANRLAPADMDEGEKIGVWTRVDNDKESCIVVEIRRGNYHVYIRGSREITR